MYKSLSGYLLHLLSTWRMMFSLSLTADDVGCDLPVTEPVSFHALTTVSATEASLLLDPEYGMLYCQNSHITSALDSLSANWSRICLSRTLNHGALWHIDSLRLRNILTYLLTYLLITFTLPAGGLCRDWNMLLSSIRCWAMNHATFNNSSSMFVTQSDVNQRQIKTPSITVKRNLARTMSTNLC